MSLNKNKNLAPVITRVFYAFTCHIQSISSGADDNHKVVNFKPGCNWIEIYRTPSNTSYDEPVKKTDAGKLFEQKLTMFFPGDDDTNLVDLDNLENQPLIVRFEYSNNTSRFFGSPDNPVAVETSYSTGRGGTLFTFECTARKHAFWI